MEEMVGRTYMGCKFKNRYVIRLGEVIIIQEGRRVDVQKESGEWLIKYVINRD